MTGGVLDALLDGIRRVNRAPAAVCAVWLVLVAVSLPATLLMRADIERHLGASLAGAGAADGVDYAWLIEFNQRAGGAAGPLSPSVIGFAAVIDTLSALFDRDPPGLVVMLTLAASFLLWIFLAGGVLDRLARARRMGAHGFLGASGRYFFRFARLALLAGAAYGLLFGVLHPWLFGGLYEDLTRNVTVERTAFLLRATLYAGFGAALAGVSLIFDYARVRTVVEDRRSMIWAVVSGIRFLRHHARKTASLYAINLALAAAILAVYAAVAPGATGALSTWAAFAIGQLYVLGRVWARLVCWASEVSLFQQHFAHAGYVARPAERWPDSPAVEALRQRSANL